MQYCECCGLANREDSRYCNGCGNALHDGALADEPLPSWLRDAAVAGYLWKGDVLLPSWLSELRPFRELFGSSTVVLPPPVREVQTAETSVPVSLADVDELAFVELTFDEDGPPESDVLVLDDVESESYGMSERLQSAPDPSPPELAGLDLLEEFLLDSDEAFDVVLYEADIVVDLEELPDSVEVSEDLRPESSPSDISRGVKSPTAN